MSYDRVKAADSKTYSSSNGRPSPVDVDEDVTAPGSPYLELINQSFSAEQDLSLPDRVITSPVLENANAVHAGQSPTIPLKPKDRIVNSLFKRGSKDTLASNNASSPIISPHSPALTRAQQPALQQGQTPSDGSSSSLSTTVSTPVLAKSILKQNRGTANNGSNGNSNGLAPSVPYSSRPAMASQQYPNEQQYAPAGYQQQPTNNLNNSYNTNSYPPLPATLAGAGTLTRPASPFAMAPSSGGSLDGRDNTNSVSSTHRSSRNLSPGADPTYNLTQTDLTLDGLAQRWYAYQAVMRKHYAEDPFYRRWTKSKWILLLTAIMLLGYSCTVFGICLGYILHKFDLAVVVMEFHGNLIYCTFLTIIFCAQRTSMIQLCIGERKRSTH
ncbi:hypothetical protein EDD21DRAFT_58125 [Dissophora ornata]|nr:hypothetical protein EDD21DRAFT_58125 [Dissophora ornata]